MFFWIFVFFLPFFAFSEASDSVGEEVLDDSKLRVRKTFPQYRIHFSHHLVQEATYKELMEERKNGEESKKKEIPEKEVQKK